jgi:hypothetical protein
MLSYQYHCMGYSIDILNKVRQGIEKIQEIEPMVTSYYIC